MKLLWRIFSSGLAVDKKIKLFFWLLVSSDAREYVTQLDRRFNALGLSELLIIHPFLFYMFRAHAFSRKGISSPKQILACLVGHYARLSQTQSIEVITQYFDQGHCLWQGQYEQLHLQLVMQYDHRMRFEGQLSLKLLLNAEEAYFVNFLLEGNTAKVVGIQGVKENKDLYKIFTKQLHGLRPQNFIWMAFLDWCRCLGLDDVQGIKPAWHVYQNEDKSLHKVGFDYALFWQEVGGIELDEQWYRLPLTYPHKPIETVEQKKRSLYKKRYLLLDALESDICQEVLNARR